MGSHRADSLSAPLLLHDPTPPISQADWPPCSAPVTFRRRPARPRHALPHRLGNPRQPRRRPDRRRTAAFIGSTIGIVAGFVGRWVDGVLMRAIDMLMAFPYLLLALAIVAALGPGLLNALARDLQSSTSPSSPARFAASPRRP